MRSTDDRYRSDQARHDLALRLIAHEARTGTIRQLTGLSDDRIRRLFGSYFKHQPGNAVRRRRGRTPSQVSMFLKTPRHRRHAASLAAAFVAGGLFDPETRAVCGDCKLDTGERLCLAYERYLALHGGKDGALLTIEWAWALLGSLQAGDELALDVCEQCDVHYVRDLLSIEAQQCPSCLVMPNGRCRKSRDHAHTGHTLGAGFA